MAQLTEQISAWSPESGNGADPLRSPLLISAVGHSFLLVAVVWAALTSHGSLVWGENAGGGSAASVKLVSAASIPLPPAAVETTNKVANEEPGLHYSEAPKPQPKPVPEKAIELPGRSARQPKGPPPPVRQEARLHRLDKEPLPGNEIPRGTGGPVQGPYGMFQTDAGAGGLQFSEGAGDFGTRYGWYVTAIRNRISQNWLQGTVDPNIRTAPRVYVAFEILRDGQVVNAQVISTSGIPSLDRSALRAVYDSNPMPQLPGDYRGSSVPVEFWFDFRR